jgi:hypothetical protein
MEIVCGPAHDQRSLKLTLPQTKKIGVFVSGGIDSALLYYLLLLEKKNTNGNQLVKPIKINRKEGSKYFAQNIINLVNQLFNIEIAPLRLGNTILPEIKQVSSAVKQAFNFPPYFDTVYIGVIHNRPEHMIGFEHIPVPEHAQVLVPFKNLEKSHIIDIYYKLGIEQLLFFTHSCDQHELVPCGRCNGCKEREWGFNQLEKQDPIKNGHFA